MATPSINPTAILKQLQGNGVTIHGPYEDAIIELIRFFEKLIDGQSADQKIALWKNWIDVTQPLIDAIKGLNK